MAVAGRKPTPYLQAVREGNPGKRARKPGMVLPQSPAVEPDWMELLPGPREMRRCRNVASAMWRRLAPQLTRSAGLTDEQRETLIDYCVTWARIDQGERAMSRMGVLVHTDRGWVKNPWLTALHQYRAHWRSLVGELGLSPSAASRISPPGDGDDDDDPFDS